MISIIFRLMAALFAGLCVSAVSAQPYPSKSLRWIIPFVPAGGLDVVTRAYAPYLAAAIGQAVVPENRPANAGILAVEFVAKAAPDGYTLLTYGTAAMMYNKLIYPDIKYDAERDFAPVTQLTTAPLALYINASVPAQTLGEFIALARNPGSKLNYGAPGYGHPFHLAMELFKERTGAELLFVPYKGGAPVIQDLIAGNLQAMFYTAGNQMPGLIKAGKIRVLASAGERRLAEYPDVPTTEEAGVRNFLAAGSFALYAPGGTPREIVARLNREIVKLSTQPEVVRAHNGQSLLVAVSTPEELFARQKREYDQWAPVIKRLGIKVE
jgi:tripartite-type tricarboxylate transporter receptor subunit TctC